MTWRPDGLGWSVTGRTRQDSFGLRLLDSDDGSVDWRCQACPARLDVTFPGGTVLSGLGYAEHLTLGLAPWKLPIDELRWGRWIAATGDRSVVWIDWRGPHPMTAVFLDGARERSATVGDDGVAAGDAVLTLTGRRTLHHRALRDIVGRSETLARLLPGAWLEVQDLKWMSLGTLEVAGARPQNGWAIHEHVTFP